MKDEFRLEKILFAVLFFLILLPAWVMPLTWWLLREGPTPTMTASPTPTNTATPTVTEASTVTPLPTATPILSTRMRVTWYGETHRGGPLFCEEFGFFDPDDPTTVAMGADGLPCGSRLRLCSESQCIVATIKDRCGGCGPGHLDLSKGGWEALGRPQSVLMTILEAHDHE